MSQFFSKICRANSSLIKILQKERLPYINKFLNFDHISLSSSQNYIYCKRQIEFKFYYWVLDA
jgi:hypothetical protein